MTLLQTCCAACCNCMHARGMDPSNNRVPFQCGCKGTLCILSSLDRKRFALTTRSGVTACVATAELL